ncbi:MAG: ATP synthase F1 subunit delta [Ruminococcaceae bacterium]|nr:ATP synthase F1 subunit delta [Oscillospiraceae bacterium]
MNQISREYATALFMLACEKDVKKDYADVLNFLKDEFTKEEDYIPFLASKSIKLSERLGAIETAFSGKIPQDVVSYLMLLCEKGRINIFLESVDIYNELLDLSMHTANAKVTSAVSLTDDEKLSLKKKLETITKKSVDIEYFIDESLIGGIVVEIDGKIIDGSVKNSLRDIKDVIIR